MIKLLRIIPLCFLVSCASLHTPSTHFVPSITQKKQFEGEASIGHRSAGVNVAYSPLKHFTLMGNVQALPFKTNTKSFQRNGELALGVYLAHKKIVWGVNLGYGMGSYNWNYTLMNDSAFYSLHTQGNFQKVMAQVFLAYCSNPSNPRWFTGISLKGNLFWDQYSTLSYSTQQNQDLAKWQNNTTFEPCIFTRNFFSKCFYLNVQVGMNISYDHTMFWPTQYVFSRVGLGIKI